MILKRYENYLTKLFLKNILIILIVFVFLSFFLNIFEEIKYFENKENELYYPIILTILNIPSIIFEILPFIFLLGVMFFFINLYENEEIELLRSNGVNNFKITFIISIISLIVGVLLIVVYYSFSANLKSLYLSMKYKYSNDPSWNLMEIGMRTKANLFISPIQDILSLDDSSRLNTPGTITNNWRWKLNQTLDEIDMNLKKYSDLGNNYGRLSN